MKVSVSILWFDAWIGVFIDRAKSTVYVCPLPCVVFKFERQSRAKRRLLAAARMLGVELLPWQVTAGERILAGQPFVLARGRNVGRGTLKRVLDVADESQRHAR